MSPSPSSIEIPETLANIKCLVLDYLVVPLLLVGICYASPWTGIPHGGAYFQHSGGRMGRTGLGLVFRPLWAPPKTESAADPLDPSSDFFFGGKREKDGILTRRLLPKPASAADFLPVHDGDNGSFVGGIHLEQRLASQSLQHCAHGLACPMQLCSDLSLRGIELPGLEPLVRLVRCIKHAVEPQCGVVGVASYRKLLHTSLKRDKALIFLSDSNPLLAAHSSSLLFQMPFT